MTEEERKEAWLADRRRGISSGDVSAILGMDGRPMDVWLNKMGMSEPVFQNERMTWGLRLQKAILEGYADRVHRPIVHADPYLFVRYGPLPILGCTLDARCADGDLRPVDAKNVGIRRPDKWGPDGSNVIPFGMAIQLHVQMMCTGTQKADLAVLFGGNNLNVFTIERDPEVERIIVETAERFWKEHIETKLPPPPDGGEGWRRFLQTIPQRRSGMAKASSDVIEWVHGIEQYREKIDAMEEEVSRLEALVKSAIGEEEGLILPNGKVTWKQANPGTKVYWEGVALNLAQKLAAKIGKKKADEALRKAAEKLTEVRPGSRRFLLTLTKREP